MRGPGQANPGDARQTARLVRLLFVLQCISMGAMEMSGPFWPIHLRAMSSSDAVFGFAGIAVYVGPMLGIVLTSAFWGRIGDRYGHKPMMLRALAGLCLTQLALAWAQDVWTVLVLRFLQGACAGYIAPAQAYGVSIENPLRRGRLFAFLQVSTNVGSLMGAVVGGLILDLATFFWINIVAAALCASCAAAVALCLPAVPPAAAPASDAKATRAARGKDWCTPQVLMLLGTIGLLQMSRMIPQTPFSLYVSSVFDVRNWVVGLCYGSLALGFIVSAAPWARYFERRQPDDTLRRMGVVVAACAALMTLAACTRSIAVFVAVYFLWGLLLGATTPVLTALISRTAGNARQGHLLGMTQSVSQISSIAGISLGGWLSQAAGLQYTYVLVAAAYLMALLPMLVLQRRCGPLLAGRPVDPA
ncbi:MFS transporter [Cupriavidus sp. WKF15]|uniref:MFS transporter n=1 Tax=Cupriavidus sp. WKF15 TaxID=3032282 RepID=UPI0023E0A3DE|nr:MFS transporter [Cupriavidus sp. WKF15]WER47949.1 MFS transporter [Cupriavidus sp. WKF15]